MSDPVTTIIDALAAFMPTITPPSGQSALKMIADPPDTIDIFPWALATEGEIEVMDGMSFGYLQDVPRIRIDLSILFQMGDIKYPTRLIREWTFIVLKALMANDTLGGAVTEMSFGPISPRPVEWNGQSYIARTYQLNCMVPV